MVLRPRSRRVRPWSAVTGLIFLAMLGTVGIVPAAAQDTHLLVVTGVAGSEEHTAKFHKWATAIIESTKRHGLADANIVYLSDKPDQDPARIQARSTRENVTKALTDLAARAKPDDEIVIVLIGHGSFDGQTGAFNLAGPDLTAADYGTLLDRFGTKRVVFVNTASSSGSFVSVLARPGRTIVAATKTGGERNETRFPEYFVEALDSEAADRDRNGRVSMLEAFEYARSKVATAYEQTGHLLTEHATLDDGAEGKLAATQFLAPPRSRSTEMASATPEMRALVEQRDALERQIAELRLRKDAMDASQYDQEFERLVTELALKTKAIRRCRDQEVRPQHPPEGRSRVLNRGSANRRTAWRIKTA